MCLVRDKDHTKGVGEDLRGVKHHTKHLGYYYSLLPLYRKGVTPFTATLVLVRCQHIVFEVFSYPSPLYRGSNKKGM